MKVLSPQIINTEKVESFHLAEELMICIDMVRYRMLLWDLRPWQDSAWRG